MTLNSPNVRRKSIRLPEFDYAGNATYFVTICTANRQPLFGDIVDGSMWLNTLGEIVDEEWRYSAELRPALNLHHMVVMPNHLHGLFTITPDQPAPSRSHAGKLSRPPRSLGSFIAGFKSAATKRINTERNMPGAPVWQPNYYEHIVRNEKTFSKIWDYIENNPATWHDDGENPDSPKFRAP